MVAWTSARTTAEIVACLGGEVPVGPVNNAADLFSDPHVRARQMLVAVEHAGAERPVVFPDTPMRFTATPAGIYRRAPAPRRAHRRDPGRAGQAGGGTMTITTELWDRFGGLDASDVPGDVAIVARQCILDWFACAVAGSAEPLAGILPRRAGERRRPRRR